jgi:hypothetical protein
MLRLGALVAAVASGVALWVGVVGAQVNEPSCTLSALSVHRFLVSSPTGEGRTGRRFENDATASCTLRGFPVIALRDHLGVIPFVFRHVAEPHPVQVPSGGSTYAIFTKFRCDLGEERTAKNGRVWLPGRPSEQATFVMHAGIGICKPGIRGEARTVNVGPFRPTLAAAYLSVR